VRTFLGVGADGRVEEDRGRVWRKSDRRFRDCSSPQVCGGRKWNYCVFGRGWKKKKFPEDDFGLDFSQASRRTKRVYNKRLEKNSCRNSGKTL